MLSKLKEWWQVRKTFRKWNRHPILGTVLHHAREAMQDQSKCLAQLEDKKQGEIIINIMQDCDEIISSSNPVQANRLKIADWSYEFAQCQVLLLDEHSSWPILHKFDGVSGELHCHLMELVEKSKYVSKMAFQIKPQFEPTLSNISDFLMLRSRQVSLILESFNIIRVGLKDFSEFDIKEWYRPYIVSQCIVAEAEFRRELGLSSAYKNDRTGLKPLAHSLWLNNIENGEQDLRWAWERAWAEMTNEPSPYNDVVWK